MATATKKPRKRAARKDRSVYAHLAMFDLPYGDRPTFRVKFKREKVRKVRDVTMEDYEPNGSTPLRDSAMDMIHLLDAEFEAKPDAVHVGLLLDESGSMGKNRASVVRSYNEFIEGIRDVEPDNAGGRVLCVILTDGIENASRRVSVHELQDAIRERERAGWTFIYLGSDQDAWNVGQRTGFSGGVRGQTVSYENTPAGTSAVMASATEDAAMYLADSSGYAKKRAGSSRRSVRASGEETLDNIATDAPTAKPYGDVQDALTRAKGGKSK